MKMSATIKKNSSWICRALVLTAVGAAAMAPLVGAPALVQANPQANPPDRALTDGYRDQFGEFEPRGERVELAGQWEDIIRRL